MAHRATNTGDPGVVGSPYTTEAEAWSIRQTRTGRGLLQGLAPPSDPNPGITTRKTCSSSAQGVRL
jgi:hypothetical protein